MQNNEPAQEPKNETILEMFEDLMGQLESATGPCPPPIRARMKAIFFAGFSSCYATVCKQVNECDDEENEEDGKRVAAMFDAYGKELAEFAVSEFARVLAGRAQSAKEEAERVAKN